jgi:hypothetical protein
MENISKELNYSPVVNNHSSIVYRTVSPQAGGSVTTNVSADVGPTEFLIPPSCWIPELTKLNFQIQLASGGGGNYNWISANTLQSISRITVYDTATSNVLLDCSNFEKYAALVTAPATDFNDFVTKANNYNVGGVLATTSDLSSPYPVEDIAKSLTTNNQLAGLTVAGTAFAVSNLGASNAYFSRRQFYIGGAATANFIDVSIPFSSMKMTALASDKIWYSPSSLVVQIYWAANNKYAFINDSATVLGGTQTAASVPSAITINRPQLILANEGNLAIVSQVINKVMSGGGIQLPIAYPTVVQTTTSGGLSQSFQYQLTRGYGNRILALLTAPFAAAPAAATRYLENSHPRYVGTYYNTFLNNVSVRSPNGFVGIGTTVATDYTVANYPYLKGSVVQNINDFIAEWEHIDGFFGNKPIKDVDQHQVDGLDVTAQSSTYQVQATLTIDAGYRWFTVIVGQKAMSLTAQGVMVQ